MRRFVPVLVLLAACAPAPVGGTPMTLAHPGPWAPAPDVLAYGNSITMPYDGAGPWDGGAHCGGGLLAGTMAIADYLMAHFPAIDTYGGYSCRPNTADTTQLSVHGTGRAVDLMISMDGTDADNDAGDPVAAWLIFHAPVAGVQYLIWDHEDWGGSRSVPKFRMYTGPIPHTDHIHMELTIAAAAMDAPWFSDHDGDGIPNATDDCPDDADPLQLDTDGDGLGDVCDPTPGTPDGGTVASPDASAATSDAGGTTSDAAAAAPDSDVVMPPHHLRSDGGCAVAPGTDGPLGVLGTVVLAALAITRRRATARPG